MAQQLEFYFDVQCPFAYLGSTQVRAIVQAAGAELIYKPMLLGGVYNALGPQGPYSQPKAAARVRLEASDVQRWADFFGVPLTFPKSHPVHTVLAMRAILASGDVPRAAHALFEAAWARGEDVSDRAVIARALGAAGFADPERILERATSEPIKQELRTRTDEAVRRGIFGAPTFFVGAEMFWGQDRLDFVARALGLEDYKGPTPPLAATPATELDFWFDYASPYAYLGATQIERVASMAGASVRLRPFLLGGLFRAIGTPELPMLAVSPAKRQYMAHELTRWAAHWHVPFKFTTRFPMRTITPLRLTHAFLRHAPEQVSPLVQSIYRGLWVEDRDISKPEVLRELCREQQLDDELVDRADDPENKHALLAAGEEAVRIGLCGAPTSVVRGKLYWGQDRLDMVAAALRGFESV